MTEREMVASYTEKYGVGVAIIACESESVETFRGLGWKVIHAATVSDVWNLACREDDPVILASGDLSGYPRKCHVLGVGETYSPGSPVVVMRSDS